ncbi:hypothetical protein LUU34_00955600 [Aix galericulata]|nr:hypothetical protein LUU34_00955600 [Aix galericulata]
MGGTSSLPLPLFWLH